jgi:hypothetical protein
MVVDTSALMAWVYEEALAIEIQRAIADVPARVGSSGACKLALATNPIWSINDEHDTASDIGANGRR